MSKSLAANATFNIVYKVLNVVFPLTMSIYVSRMLMPAGVGEVQFASSIASYFVTFAALGLPSYGVREVSRARQRGDLDRVFSELFILNAVSSLVSAAAYCVLIYSLYGSSQSFVLHIVFVSQIVLNLFNIDWFYQGLEEFAFIAVRSIVIKLLSIVLMFFFIQGTEDTLAYAALLCAGSVGNYIFNVVRLPRYVNIRLRGLRVKRHLGPVLYLLVVSAAADIYGRLNTTLLGVFSTTEATGLYSCGLNCLNACLQMLLAVTAVFLPRLSILYRSDRAVFNRLVSRGIEILLFTSVPLLIGIQFVADDVTVILFGESFAPAADVIRILSPLLLVKGIGDLMCYQVLLAAGRERLFLPSRILGSITNLVFGIPLIASFSQNGAALASVASEVAVNAPLFFSAARVARPKLARGFLMSCCCAAIGLTISLIPAAMFLPAGPMRVAGEVLIGGTVYLIISLQTKSSTLIQLIEMVKAKIIKRKSS